MFRGDSRDKHGGKFGKLEVGESKCASFFICLDWTKESVDQIAQGEKIAGLHVICPDDVVRQEESEDTTSGSTTVRVYY